MIALKIAEVKDFMNKLLGSLTVEYLKKLSQVA